MNVIRQMPMKAYPRLRRRVLLAEAQALGRKLIAEIYAVEDK